MNIPVDNIKASCTPYQYSKSNSIHILYIIYIYIAYYTNMCLHLCARVCMCVYNIHSITIYNTYLVILPSCLIALIICDNESPNYVT